MRLHYFLSASQVVLMLATRLATLWSWWRSELSSYFLPVSPKYSASCSIYHTCSSFLLVLHRVKFPLYEVTPAKCFAGMVGWRFVDDDTSLNLMTKQDFLVSFSSLLVLAKWDVDEIHLVTASFSLLRITSWSASLTKCLDIIGWPVLHEQVDLTNWIWGVTNWLVPFFETLLPPQS